VTYSKYKDMETVELILKEASAYGLQEEVKLWANKMMQDHPQLNEVDAYTFAYHEWVK
jgi:hypothetical protein